MVSPGASSPGLPLHCRLLSGVFAVARSERRADGPDLVLGSPGAWGFAGHRHLDLNRSIDAKIIDGEAVSKFDSIRRVVSPLTAPSLVLLSPTGGIRRNPDRLAPS